MSDEERREKAIAAAKARRKAEAAETEKAEAPEEEVKVAKTATPVKRTPNRQKMIDVDKEFSKERAAYEARQAEIARRREAARAKERLRVNLSDDEPTRVVPEVSAEEDSELAMSQRMAYQRRKLEERLNRNDE